MKYYAHAAILGVSFALLGGMIHAAEPVEPAKNGEVKNEPVVNAPITEISIFKNGLASVFRSIPAVPPGPFLIREALEPIHGTIWFSPSDGLDVKTVERCFQVPDPEPFSDLSKAYRGQSVEINGSVIGTVVSFSGKQPRKYADYNPNNNPNMFYYPRQYPQPQLSNPGYLTLRLADGSLYTIRSSEIKTIKSAAVNTMESRDETVYLLNRRARIAGPLQMNYLTRGLLWLPSYRVVLGTDSKLTFSMAATLTNELEDLQNVRMKFVTGFPNITFQRLLSPMAERMTIAEFFRILATRDNELNNVASQQIVMNVASRGGSDSYSTGAMEESLMEEDLQAYDVGSISLKKGESQYFSLMSGEAEYEHLINWEIPFLRENDSGNLIRFQDPYQVRNYTDKERALYEIFPLWSSIRFKNPFKNAVTTAPVEFCSADGTVLAQTQTSWVNPGQSMILPITKSLSILGTCRETMKLTNSKDRPNIPRQNHADYVNWTVSGVLTLQNRRNTPEHLRIRMNFFGEFLSADEKPVIEKNSGALSYINTPETMTWEIDLKPMETLNLNYSYRTYCSR